MKKWNVCFGVKVPCYGSMTIEAETAQEAERIAMLHHETAKETLSEWESKIWHEAINLETYWPEAEEFRLLETLEV